MASKGYIIAKKEALRFKNNSLVFFVVGSQHVVNIKEEEKQKGEVDRASHPIICLKVA